MFHYIIPHSLSLGGSHLANLVLDNNRLTGLNDEPARSNEDLVLQRIELLIAGFEDVVGDYKPFHLSSANQEAPAFSFEE